MKKSLIAPLAVGLALLSLTACSSASAPGGSKDLGPDTIDDALAINQIQVVGSHNSYHREASKREKSLRKAIVGDLANALEYNYATVGEQLGQDNVRQLEFDVWADPKGGLYAKPLIRTLTLGGPTDPELRQPGNKVLHIQDIDYRSNCLTFRDCLQEVKTWSDKHPAHIPITLLIEFKDTALTWTAAQKKEVREQQAEATEGKTATQKAQIASAVKAALLADPVPWTGPLMDTVDADITSVFTPEETITPDDVRDGAETLESAVLNKGWPTIGTSRGKVMFLMDNAGTYRDSYLQGHPSLKGRVLFTNSTPGQPDAAFVEQNDPIGQNTAKIQDLVRKGYLVRTRADQDTAQARTDDTSLRDAALASGAQFVSTDYPAPGIAARFGTDYAVTLPGQVSVRCNPVFAAELCAAGNK